MSRYKMFHVPFNQIHYILAILNLSLLKMNLNEFKLDTYYKILKDCALE